MSGVEIIGSVGGFPSIPLASMNSSAAIPSTADFTTVLTQIFQDMETKVRDADRLVGQFALDDDVPLHDVTIALEEARISVELVMHLRTGFLEVYREMINMQI